MASYSLNRLHGRVLLLLCIIVLSNAFSSKAQTVTNNGDTITIVNGTTLYINGGFSNTDNGSLHAYVKNNGIMNMNGDFIKSSNMFYTGDDSLIVSGNGSENIAGLTYGYIGITGGGIKTLTGDAYVNKKIAVTNGNLYTGSYTLTLDSAATMVEDSVNNIIGQTAMTKYLQTGVTGTFGSMGLDIRADSMSPGLTSVLRTTGQYLSSGSSQSVNRYFTVTPANNGNTGSTITFHYYDGELNSLSEQDIGMYRLRANSQWEYDSFIVRNSGLNTVQTRVDTLGTFTAGSISNPLPVELLSFTASLHRSTVALLNWTTVSELNNDHFEIERSTDGRFFTKVGEEKGNGNSSATINYQYLDNFGTIPSSLIYYRLKQVDYNGASKYSEIRVLRLSVKNTDAFNAWYNMSIDKMEASFYYDKETLATLQMIDIQGKRIVTQSATFPKGSSHLQLDMSGLAKGIYTLSVIYNDGEAQVKRVVKN